MADLNMIRIGWIGLGSMGNAMAKNVQRHIFPRQLSFYNRTKAKGGELADLGGVYCNVPDIVRHSDIIFLSLSDDAAVSSMADQLLSSCESMADKIIVDTTTVHPHTTKAIDQKIQSHGGTLVAGPVFGATPVAEEGQLLMAVAGPQAAIQKIVPLVDGIVARQVLYVASQPEKAVLLKTLGNFMTAAMMELVAEAHVVAEKTGLDSDMLERLIELNFGAVAFSSSKRMTGGVYCPPRGQLPHSGLDLALKDVGHGTSTAASVEANLPIAQIVLQNLHRAKLYSNQHNGRPLDSSSLYGALREEAGLDFRTDLVQTKDRDAA